MGTVASPLGGSGCMLPQKIFGFISSEIASGVILNIFALFVTLLFWYSRSRRGASARSYGAPYVRFIVVCQAVETRAAHVYNRVWCNFFLMLTRLVRDYIQSCEEGRCCVHWIRGRGGGGNGPCVPPPWIRACCTCPQPRRSTE